MWERKPVSVRDSGPRKMDNPSGGQSDLDTRNGERRKEKKGKIDSKETRRKPVLGQSYGPSDPEKGFELLSSPLLHRKSDRLVSYRWESVTEQRNDTADNITVVSQSDRSTVIKENGKVEREGKGDIVGKQKRGGTKNPSLRRPGGGEERMRERAIVIPEQQLHLTTSRGSGLRQIKQSPRRLAASGPQWRKGMEENSGDGRVAELDGGGFSDVNPPSATPVYPPHPRFSVGMKDE
ncbi:hypothetical protein WH47_06413 [Habropoda laboriosa]|uniref:Uncharacterized protein n=1 Tax=Habropoda laboriosa TaxID=597456 RepID=A0A0L7RC99_9HYME|nr:hypothetical protein WH47_06413 [Habropoda laboriosa]